MKIQMTNELKVKSVALFVAASLACLAANAATINWQPVNGDWSGDFGDPNHWDSGAVPGSGDDATFPASSPREFTLTVNAEYTVHKIAFVDAARKVTITGTGKISTVYAGSLANTIGRYNHVVLDGASFHSGYQLLHYGTLEVRAGSTFSNGDTFYLWEPNATVIVDGGTCTFRTIYCNDTSVNGGVYVKNGSLTSDKGMTSTKAGRPAVLDVSGGTVSLKSLTMSIAGSRLSLSGGALTITDTSDGALNVAADAEVSLTGGTFSWQHDLSDPRFYATDGADVDIGTKQVMVTNGPVVAKSAGALIARGFRNGSVANSFIDGTFPKIIFTYPDGYFWVDSGSYKRFCFNGPTTIGATCNMIVNLGHTLSHTLFKGDITVDTLDYRDRTTKRTICTRGLHPTDGEATLTVTGGGTYQVLESLSYNSFKSVTVDDGTTLTLLDRPANVEYGPLVAESFTMKANSKLALNAGANHVQAKTFAIDPSATITVTVPSTFTTGAAPILQTTDQTTPSVSLSQITLAGSTEGVLLKNENGQVTVYKPGSIDGTYATEWTGAGADNCFSTAENWYGNALPNSSQIIYFGASTVTNPRWGVIAGGGSTVGGYLFRDTATETFSYSSNGETMRDYLVDGTILHVGTWAGVPQFVNGSLRRDGWLLSFGARCAAPLVLGGNGTYTWTNSKKYMRICGDVRLNKNGFTGSGFDFHSAPTTKTPYTRLTVLPGTTATMSSQVDDFAVGSAGVRIETGASLTFGNGSGAFYRWAAEPAKQVVNGTLDIQAPFYGGVKQTYGGEGRMNIASVKSGTAASRVQLADSLNVYPGDWTTVTSDADNPVALTAIGGTPTIHLASNWRYGVAAGVATSSVAAARALEIEKGAVLTLDAGGNTATIDEDVAGEGTLVITNGTLAVNSTAASSVNLKVAAEGVLALPNNLNFGSLELMPGSAIMPPADLKNRRGWQTVLVAADVVAASGCALPVGYEMRTETVEGGVALQLRFVRGGTLVVW